MSDEKHCGCSNGTSKDCKAWPTPKGCFCLCHGWSEAAQRAEELLTDWWNSAGDGTGKGPFPGLVTETSKLVPELRALARPSTGGGATNPAASACGNLYENAETIRARGQRTLTVEDIQSLVPADPGRLDPVEAIREAKCDCPRWPNVCAISSKGPLFCASRIRAAIPATRVGIDPATLETVAQMAEADHAHRDVVAFASRIRALSQGTATPKWRAEHVDGFGALMMRATPPEAKGTGMLPGQRCVRLAGHSTDERGHEYDDRSQACWDVGHFGRDGARCSFVEPSPTKDGGKP